MPGAGWGVRSRRPMGRWTGGGGFVPMSARGQNIRSNRGGGGRSPWWLIIVHSTLSRYPSWVSTPLCNHDPWCIRFSNCHSGGREHAPGNKFQQMRAKKNWRGSQRTAHRAARFPKAASGHSVTRRGRTPVKKGYAWMNFQHFPTNTEIHKNIGNLVGGIYVSI